MTKTKEKSMLAPYHEVPYLLSFMSSLQETL
jgi:hypothetical protein